MNPFFLFFIMDFVNKYFYKGGIIMRFLIIKRKSMLIVFGALILSLMLIGVQDSVKSVTANSLKPIYSAKVDNNRIGITFDISWGNQNILPILDILNQENVKATFFLSSPWAEDHSEFVNQIVANGHEIGSHGRRHVDFNTLSQSALTKELELSREVLEKMTNQKITLLRPPNGAYDNKTISTANNQGYKVIQWSVDSLDWKKPGPKMVIEYVINGRKSNNGASPGDIILFHASDSAPDTPLALPTIIKTLKEKNYELVPVGILLKDAQETWPPESNL